MVTGNSSSSVVAETLWNKAADRSKAQALLCKEKLWELALEAAHLSVEISFNAFLVESGKSLDDLKGSQHSLTRLAGIPVVGAGGEGGITVKMRGVENKGIRNDLSVISSAWRMHYRYERLPLTEAKLIELLPIFERYYQWTLKNLKKFVGK